ncbi:hypothetical protein [Brachybacterium sacelli]|uniref:hypothetical protein n=1 Tax=Brachybacterium sacelli TaxID=173364 RepID=UPI003621B096
MTMFLSNRWDGTSLPASAQDESHYEAGPVMSHAAGIVIPAVDMLLIKPSWWARAGAGTRPPPDRSRE